MLCSIANCRVMDIANVLAVSGPIGVGTRAGTTVPGQRQACDHPNGGKLRDGPFAICLSPQMTANQNKLARQSFLTKWPFFIGMTYASILYLIYHTCEYKIEHDNCLQLHRFID